MSVSTYYSPSSALGREFEMDAMSRFPVERCVLKVQQIRVLPKRQRKVQFSTLFSEECMSCMSPYGLFSL